MSLYLGIEKLGLSSIFLCHFNTGSLGTSSCLVTIGRLPLMTFGVRFLGCCIDGGCKNSVHHLLQVSFFTIFAFVLTLIYISFFFFSTKKRKKLKSRYKGHIQAATEYVKKIEDFDDLVDPRTLARHFLGPKPSPFV